MVVVKRYIFFYTCFVARLKHSISPTGKNKQTQISCCLLYACYNTCPGKLKGNNQSARANSHVVINYGTIKKKTKKQKQESGKIQFLELHRRPSLLVKEKRYVHAFATRGGTVPRLQSLATSSIVPRSISEPEAGYFQTGHISEDSSKTAHASVRSHTVR